MCSLLSPSYLSDRKNCSLVYWRGFYPSGMLILSNKTIKTPEMCNLFQAHYEFFLQLFLSQIYGIKYYSIFKLLPIKGALKKQFPGTVRLEMFRKSNNPKHNINIQLLPTFHGLVILWELISLYVLCLLYTWVNNGKKKHFQEKKNYLRGRLFLQEKTSLLNLH